MAITTTSRVRRSHELRVRRGRASFSIGRRGPRASYRLGCALPMLVALVVACGGRVVTETLPVQSFDAEATPSCGIPPRTYDDLASCDGQFAEISAKIAESYQGKTVVKIAVKSKDPDAIVSAMGASVYVWSTGADSFTVFAFGSKRDAEAGGYNRGRIFWNNGGPITVDVCTAWAKVGGIDTCTDQDTYTVANR